MDFVAIDLKTADFEGKDICSIGVVIVESNLIVSAREYQINSNSLKDDNQFVDLWNEINALFNKRLVVSFNANKQMNLLLNMLDEHKIKRPAFNFACGRFVAKKLWRDLYNYKLPTIADHLGISNKEEKAKKNAIICSEIFLRALEAMKVYSVEALYDSLDLQFGYFDDVNYKVVGRKAKSNKSPDFIQLTELKSKNIVFTGTLQSMVRREAMRKVICLGGYCSNIINNNTDILVVGVQSRAKLRGKDKSSKMLKAERLKSEGKYIAVITEDEFLKMLSQST